MGKTKISWTDETWNPTRGCRRVSAGCEHCYAERQAARFAGKGGAYEGLITIGKNGPRWNGKARFVPKMLLDPLAWRKPRRVFVDSMSDLFHEDITNEEIAAVYGIMAASPRHTYQVLTKRPKRMLEWFAWLDDRVVRQRNAARSTLSMDVRYAVECWHFAIEAMPALAISAWADEFHKVCTWIDEFHGACETTRWPLSNVWQGVSVENQATADERVPLLLERKNTTLFLSIEPLLGPVDLDTPHCDNCRHEERGNADDGTPWCTNCDSEMSYGHWLGDADAIHWVIVGCESGPGARACDVAWIRAIRDECIERGVPFFLKQAELGGEKNTGMHGGIRYGAGSSTKGSEKHPICEAPYLDGVQHLEFPEKRSDEP